jgi:hypothetical protein
MPRARSLRAASVQPNPVREIMTIRWTQLRFAAAVLAIAAISSAGSPARAFTFQSIGGTNAGGSAKLADPDDQVKSPGKGGVSLFGSNGPTVEFNAGQGPIGRFQGLPSGPPPPQPYGARSMGNND